MHGGAYETLGRITGETEQAACAGQIPEDARKRVLYAQGEYGTEVPGAGGVHAEVLDYTAAQNVAVLSAVASGGGRERDTDRADHAVGYGGSYPAA